MKFFVTGVNGQLGHDVMNELNKRGHTSGQPAQVGAEQNNSGANGKNGPGKIEKLVAILFH